MTTCIPCFGVYCLAMWVRSGLWEKERKREAERKKAAENIPEKAWDAEEEVGVMQKEIQRLKLLALVNVKHNPQLSTESLKRIFAEETTQSKKEIKPQPKTVDKENLTDRIWNSIKPWIPFYVEPFNRQQGVPPKTDFTALMKAEKPVSKQP